MSGTGMQRIEDPSIAQALLDKTVAMDKTFGWQSLVIAAGLDALAAAGSAAYAASTAASAATGL